MQTMKAVTDENMQVQRRCKQSLMEVASDRKCKFDRKVLAVLAHRNFPHESDEAFSNSIAMGASDSVSASAPAPAPAP